MAPQGSESRRIVKVGHCLYSQALWVSSFRQKHFLHKVKVSNRSARPGEYCFWLLHTGSVRRWDWLKRGDFHIPASFRRPSTVSVVMTVESKIPLSRAPLRSLLKFLVEVCEDSWYPMSQAAVSFRDSAIVVWMERANNILSNYTWSPIIKCCNRWISRWKLPVWRQQ